MGFYHTTRSATSCAHGNRTKYTYDAWNRLVATAKAYRDDTAALQTGSTVQQLTYDALGRRIVQQVQNSADLDRTEHSYHAGQSVVEVRNGSGLLLKQQLWAGTFGIPGGYIDQLLQLAVNADPFATDGSEDVCEAVFYALHDANYNLLALVDDAGAITERYEYTPYGQRTVYFSPGPNDPLAMAPTTISRRWQIGGVSQPYGLNSVGHQGLSHDAVTGLVHNRARMLHPRLGRFMQRDPLGYVDGMSLYAYYAGMRGAVDPNGLESVWLWDQWHRGNNDPEEGVTGPDDTYLLSTHYVQVTLQHRESPGGWFDDIRDPECWVEVDIYYNINAVQTGGMTRGGHSEFSIGMFFIAQVYPARGPNATYPLVPYMADGNQFTGIGSPHAVRRFKVEARDTQAIRYGGEGSGWIKIISQDKREVKQKYTYRVVLDDDGQVANFESELEEFLLQDEKDQDRLNIPLRRVGSNHPYGQARTGEGYPMKP